MKKLIKKENNEINHYFWTFKDFLTVSLRQVAWILALLPPLRLANADFLRVTFATPLELVLALYVLPLNLNVTVFFFRYFCLLWRVLPAVLVFWRIFWLLLFLVLWCVLLLVFLLLFFQGMLFLACRFLVFVLP